MSRSSFRRSGFNAIGSFLDNSLEDMGLRHKLLEVRVLKKWPEVVGQHIADATFAENLKDGILFVSCKSSAWANELTLLKNDIQKRLNEAVGKEIVSDIRFSPKGYRKAKNEAAKANSGTAAKEIDKISLDEYDIKKAERIASAASDEDLINKIRKAIITSKKLEKAKLQEGWKKCPVCSELHKGKDEKCKNCSAKQK